MIPKKILLPQLFLLSVFAALGQGPGVTPQDLLQPLKNSWPTYNGDYTGKRYSLLTQVNRSNVKNLTLGWMTQLTQGAESPDSASAEPEEGGERKPPVIVGGEGPGNIIIRGGTIKASVLEVDGTLVFHHAGQRLGCGRPRRT